MGDAIKEIVKACHALEGKDSSPSIAGTLANSQKHKFTDYINIFSYNRVIFFFFFPSENVAGAPI